MSHVSHLNVLVIDIGGTHIKMLATGQAQPQKLLSGPTMAPKLMVSGVKKLTAEWTYDVVSIGYPGPVLKDRPVAEPHHLAAGWVGFPFREALGRPVKVINDAAMQALGSYKGGKLLFLGLGTGLGSAMVVDGIVEPMELGHLPYKKGTYEEYIGLRGLEKWGKKKWRCHVADVVARLIAALLPDDVVLGGGNVKKLKELPPGCRAGDNACAFVGGFRLWGQTDDRICPLPENVRSKKLGPETKGLLMATPTERSSKEANRQSLRRSRHDIHATGRVRHRQHQSDLSTQEPRDTREQ